MFPAQYAVTEELGKIKSIGAEQRKSKMNNDRIQQIVTAMFMHRKLTSEGVHKHRSESLTAFAERMSGHPEHYKGNTQVMSGFTFLAEVINAWFPKE